MSESREQTQTSIADAPAFFAGEWSEETILPLGEIDPDSRNPRLAQLDTEGMLAYAKSRVALEKAQTWGNALWVYPSTDPRGVYKYELLDGKGRLSCSMEAGWDTINVKVFQGSQQDAEFLRMLANRWGRELTPYELASWLVGVMKLYKLRSEQLLEMLERRGLRTVSQGYYSKLMAAWCGVIQQWKDAWARNAPKVTVRALLSIRKHDTATQLYLFDQYQKSGETKLRFRPPVYKKTIESDPLFVGAKFVRRQQRTCMARAVVVLDNLRGDPNLLTMAVQVLRVLFTDQSKIDKVLLARGTLGMEATAAPGKRKAIKRQSSKTTARSPRRKR